MSNDNLLGQLSGLHQMMAELVESLPEADCYQSYNPQLAPLAWFLGRGMYIETYWLREIVQGDDDMTSRVREIFIPGILPSQEEWKRLPPKDHLLNWVMELQDENIMRLANPDQLPNHPLIENGRLLHLIIQGQAKVYEKMLQVLAERRLHQQSPYQVQKPLISRPPQADHTGISQGHYRIGAKSDPSAFDNEQPAQIVELSSFRIDRQPVGNSTFLAFIEAGGYENETYWSPTGWSWNLRSPNHPHSWRKDNDGHWFGNGINGQFDLIAEDPVTGVTHHEALAYANWVAGLGGELTGAVLQHEFQWEAATRTQGISDFGRVWEWCANTFEPYTGFQSTHYQEARTGGFDNHHFPLRGGSLHTQRALRRLSYRKAALPDADSLFSGIRLVYPAK
ncbi:MAG: SUMF1/EgtB/PvdO family nonheme iron enzyme [Candidatus Sedimenticola sp. (ex Thyasira tokunagai)]